MIITIGGKPGSGKSVVGKALAKKLGYDFFSAGDFARDYAKKQNRTILNQAEIAKKDFGIDKKIDKEVLKLRKKKDIVVEAHLSAFLIPKAQIKIYLEASLWLRAKRISKRDKVGFLKAFFNLSKRDGVDIKRWKKEYNFDYRKKKYYNFVINTNNGNINKVANKILDKIKGGMKK